MGEFPSKDHQFKPGNPGGPGRPKGKSISTILKEIGELATKTPATIGGVQDLVDGLLKGDAEDGWLLTTNQALALRLIAIGLHDYDSGQARKAIVDIQNRTEGRAPLPIKNADDGPLEIRVVYADDPAHDPPAPPGAGDDPPEDEAL